MATSACINTDKLKGPEAVAYAEGNVPERIHGYTTGPTIWALRLQVKRDVENATDQQKLVPYGVVLAYCEQVGEEAVRYLNVKLDRQGDTLFRTRMVLCVVSLTALAYVAITGGTV